MTPSWTFFLTFTFVIASTNAEGEYCYSRDDKPYGYFGSETPYSNVRSAEISTPKDCSVVYVWALIRHGTRYANENYELTSETLKSIRDEIIQNHKKHNRGKLCKDDLEDLKNWKYPWEDKLFGLLMPQGWRDMENLAENLKTQLPEFFKSASNDKFKIQSSTRSRCQNSAIAFTNELYGSTSNDVDENKIQINNYMLRTQSRKKASDIDELNKFKKSILMDDVLSQISSRLGFAAKLDFDLAQKLYKQCSFEKALNIKAKSAFCAAFTPEHLKVMEYCEDLDTYYTLGHGEPKFKNQACPLMLDLYRKLEDVQIKSNPSEKGNFYFAHKEILLPFLTKLGLYRDQQPLTSDDYATRGGSRLWRTSLMSPFGANFIAVMYKCNDEMSVSFYLNEALIKFPFCKDGLCSWKTLKDGAFKNEFLEDCNGVMELEVAKDVQKKEEKGGAENTIKNDKSDSAKSQDSTKKEKDTDKELKEMLHSVVKDLVTQLEHEIPRREKSSRQDGTEDENMKMLKEIKSKLEDSVKDNVKKESNSSKKSSKGSGAAGLQSMELQTICLIALLTIVGLLGKFIQ